MAVQIITYVALVVLVIFSIVRIIKYAKMPIHLRWELYPIPHEKGEGSYFEELDWWTKPRHKDMMAMAKFMFFEILFLRALYHENKRMWYVSFPFHFGLYLYVAWAVTLLIGTVFGLLGLAGADSVLGSIVYYVTLVTGVGAFAIGALGTFGLLMMRLLDAKLKMFSSFKDYFNLVLILALFVTGLLAWIADRSFGSFFAYMYGLMTFNAVGPMLGWALIAHLLIQAFFMAYFPFTHMTHAFAKYFMWDKVRFSDDPNMPGSKIEAQVREVLSYPVSWSAAHINAGGRSWAEVATSAVGEEEKK